MRRRRAVQEVVGLASWIRRERAAGEAARATIKAPFVAKAAASLDALRTLPLAAAMAELGVPELSVPADPRRRHGWEIGAIEQLLVSRAACCRSARLAFELGTFDGGTTLAMARSMGAGREVHTIDLPHDRFVATQSPVAFGPQDVGRAFASVPDRAAMATIIQHRGDTLTFDFSPWTDCADLVLVDGAHDHEHGRSDSETALRLLAPGGVVFWDDMEPYWHGLVHGVIEAVGADRLTKIARTSLVYFVDN